MAITLELPPEREQQLRLELPDLERHALEGLVVEAYRQGKLSDYEVGVFLGFASRWQAIQFLSERGVYPNYDQADWEEDLRGLQRQRESKAAR